MHHGQGIDARIAERPRQQYGIDSAYLSVDWSRLDLTVNIPECLISSSIHYKVQLCRKT